MAGRSKKGTATLKAGWLVKEVPAGTSLRKAVFETAKEASYVSFRVYLNGKEISEAEAPEKLKPGDEILILPDTKVG